MKKIIIVLFCMFSLFVGNKAFAYNPNKAESGDFGSATVVNVDLNFQPGTGTTNGSDSARVRIFFGTQSCTGSGTEGVIQRGTLTGLPYIDYSYRNGSSTFDFVGFTNFKVGGVAVAYGVLGDYILATNGTQTGMVGTNTTHGGTNTVPSNAVFTANGRTMTAIELSYIDGLSDFLTTLLAAKQADLGGTYCASISDDVGTRTGAIRLGASGDLTLSIINGEFVYGLAGSASAKSSTMENGGTVTASPAFIDYDGDDFDPVGSGTGSRIKLSVAQKGSTTPTANTVMKAGSTGTSSLNWFDAGFCYAYKTTNMASVGAGTWTNIPLDSDLNDSKYGTHSVTANTDQIKVLVPGMYEIAGMAHARASAASIGIRVCKNNQSEIPGSFAMSYMNYGDGNSGMPIIITPVHARLNANDYIYMQVAHNFAGTSTPIDYSIQGTMPSPGTSSYAHLSIRKIGE